MLYITPPEVVQADVFFRLPEAFRRPGRRSAWADANRAGATVDCFLEGPSFDRVAPVYRSSMGGYITVQTTTAHL